MDESFQVWIDRLKGGQTQKINEKVPPKFLDIEEKELQFEKMVQFTGEAYLTDKELVLHLTASTEALMPCAICNKMILQPIEIKNFYHAEPLDNIPRAVFDFKDTLREALLLELPKFVECQGKCPDRTLIAPYMRPKGQKKPSTHYPFNDL